MRDAARRRRPALPLDEAGKYVAGAYVVFVVLIVVYVAIMAAKLQRIERELRELAGDRRASARQRRSEARGGERLMAELLALGVSHKTAPLDLRERLSLTEGRAVGALRELTAAERDPRGGGDLDLQPHRALPGRLRPGRGRVDRRSACSPARRRSARPSCSATSTRCAPARPPATSSGSPPGSTR